MITIDKLGSNDISVGPPMRMNPAASTKTSALVRRGEDHRATSGGSLAVPLKGGDIRVRIASRTYRSGAGVQVARHPLTGHGATIPLARCPTASPHIMFSPRRSRWSPNAKTGSVRRCRWCRTPRSWVCRWRASTGPRSPRSVARGGGLPRRPVLPTRISPAVNSSRSSNDIRQDRNEQYSASSKGGTPGSSRSTHVIGTSTSRSWDSCHSDHDGASILRSRTTRPWHSCSMPH